MDTLMIRSTILVESLPYPDDIYEFASLYCSQSKSYVRVYQGDFLGFRRSYLIASDIFQGWLGGYELID